MYDTSKGISCRPLALSWLCLHIGGGVYLQCQDQSWPQINNILRTCILAAYRLGNINLSHPPLLLVSTVFLTSSVHFSLTVKLIDLIFSWAVLDASFIWLSIKRLPIVLSLLFCCVFIVLSPSQHNTGLLHLSSPQQLICLGPHNFLGDMAIK